MASCKINLPEISQIVSKIGRVQNIQELENQNYKDQLKIVLDVTKDYFSNKFHETESVEIAKAFIQGDPGKSYCRLLEFRSGKLGPPLDIENETNFAKIYVWFISSLLNMMNKGSLKEYGANYLSQGCIKSVLRELGSKEFKQYLNKSSDESQTAFVIGIHLSLIYNVSFTNVLRSKLAEELRKNGYFPILKDYAKSMYG